jgi:exopolysaccharide production protein ExoQ
MTHVTEGSLYRPRPFLTLCPNTLLTFAAFVGLFFVSWLGSLGALLFLAAGLSLFLLAPRETAGGLVDNWWMLLLPLWCILSFAWSSDPNLSMRHGIQLALTVVIGIAMATRLSPGMLVRALFFAGLLAAVASVAFGRARLDGAGFLGIYASKNDFAFAMVIFLCSATALVLGRETGQRMRLLAAASVFLAFGLVVMAQSVGWLGAAVGIMVTGSFILLLRIVSISIRFIAVVLTLMLMMALIQFVRINAEAFLTLFSEMTGKDPTLTGRTYLWDIARSEIETARFWGQGYQAYWVRGNPVAEEIWQEFGIASRSGFHFHNTWLSNWVEIGAIGIALQAIVFVWALLGSVWRALVAPQAESLFFAMLLVALAAMSIGEVVMFMQFHTASVLVLTAAVFASRARREGLTS